MIKVKHRGNFNHLEAFFKRVKDMKVLRRLDHLGQDGVAALSAATPVRTGKTAASWSYDIEEEAGRYKIAFKNSNINKGINIAIIIQKGHATGGGGYVEGIDYINPALRSLFENMADEVWKEVTGS